MLDFLDKITGVRTLKIIALLALLFLAFQYGRVYISG
jgi:hypothetical protein